MLAYIAFAMAPMSRESRVSAHRQEIATHYAEKQQEFLDFVLGQYVREGVGELDQAKLPHLLKLKYHAVNDAVERLGSIAEIRDVFVGFQKYLYGQKAAV